MVDSGALVATPPQDYDDSYSIQYAFNHGGCVLTNDRFNDYVEKGATGQEKGERREWVRSHSISFTFVGDEFVPNPDFGWPSW